MQRLGEPSKFGTKDAAKGIDVNATQWSHSGGYILHFNNKSDRHVFNATLTWSLTNAWLLAPDSGDTVKFSIKPGDTKMIRCQPITDGGATAYSVNGSSAVELLLTQDTIAQLRTETETSGVCIQLPFISTFYVN